MLTRENLQKKLEITKEYINLGKSLEGIVDEQKDAAELSKAVLSLKKLSYIYDKMWEYEECIRGIEEERDNELSILAEKGAYLFGSREKALASFKAAGKKNPLVEFYSYFFRSKLYWCLSVIVSPFSRDLSEAYHQVSVIEGETKNLWSNIYRKEEKIKDFRKQHLRSMQEREIFEARLFDKFKEETKLDDDSTLIVFENPELVYCGVIEIIRRK